MLEWASFSWPDNKRMKQVKKRPAGPISHTVLVKTDTLDGKHCRESMKTFFVKREGAGEPHIFEEEITDLAS